MMKMVQTGYKINSKSSANPEEADVPEGKGVRADLVCIDFCVKKVDNIVSIVYILH